MARGLDVYAFSDCDGLGCVVRPTNTPGSTGGGQLAGELAEFKILLGTPAARPSSGFEVAYVLGAPAPTNGVPGVGFVVEVEDLGRAGADTFRIVTGTGYGAFGVVSRGNLTVSGGLPGL